LLVPPRDADATADALSELLEPEARRRASAATSALAAELRWPELMAPLVEAVERAVPRRPAPGRLARSLADAGGYYARRAVDRVVRLAGV
jgi:hypothetical protein